MEAYLERIKQLKSNKKITNALLAERTGIPLGTLSKILAGMNESPKLANIVAICEALDCSVEYIICGTPENRHNYTLEEREIALIERYRTLDAYGRQLVDMVLEKESERNAKPVEARQEEVRTKSAKVLGPVPTVSRTKRTDASFDEKRFVLLYDLPVSAGQGVYLDDSHAEKIRIPAGGKAMQADYALRIYGNSMESKYHDGDILLVQHTESVAPSEAGIFLLDGCGYFKIFEGDRLHSLNPAYDDILLKNYSDVQCKGRVLGKLKRV